MKNRTRPLRARDYIALPAGAVTVNLTRLVDDALDRLATIRATCYGLGNGRRSRAVVHRSFVDVLQQGQFSQGQAEAYWREQVLPLETLAINADE